MTSHPTTPLLDATNHHHALESDHLVVDLDHRLDREGKAVDARAHGGGPPRKLAEDGLGHVVGLGHHLKHVENEKRGGDEAGKKKVPCELGDYVSVEKTEVKRK